MSKIDNIIKSDSKRYDIGAGGHGKIFMFEKFPSYVIKRSKDREICIDWYDEFNIQNKISNKWARDFPNLIDYVEPIKVHEMMHDDKDSKCYILMDRICPIIDTELDKLNGKTSHAFIGECDKDVKDVGDRGNTVGQDIIARFIDLPKTVNALGIFMSWLHYTLKYDGNDLEFIIGKSCMDDDRIKIFVIDFGMIKKIVSYEDQKYDIANSLNYLPYFPLNYNCSSSTHDLVKHSYKNLINIFKESYINQANNSRDIAIDIYNEAV